MAPHSGTLAWKIPWMKEPGRLQSMGSLSRAQLSDFTFTFHFHGSEKEMATHSSILAWKIPGTEGPGGLQSMGSQTLERTEQLNNNNSVFHIHVSYLFLCPQDCAMHMALAILGSVS